MSQPRGDRYDRFVAAVETPMLVLAVVFVVFLVAPVAWPAMPPGVKAGLRIGEWLIWTAFAAEYVVKVTLAPDRWRFVRTHLPDLVVVAVPMLRPLRLVRSARVLRVLRVGRVASAGNVAARRSRRRLATRVAAYTTVVAALLVVVCAIVVLDLERDRPDAAITSLGDALWWSFVALTTLGLVDPPVTAAGRVVGGVLLVGGIALSGVITASLASYFVDHAHGASDDNDVVARLDRIEQELRRLHSGSAGDTT